MLILLIMKNHGSRQMQKELESTTEKRTGNRYFLREPDIAGNG